MKLIAKGLLILLASAPMAAADERLVREFSGSSPTLTGEFTVESPWLLDWRLNGDYEQLMALDISLIDARTGRHVGRVKHTKVKSNGLRLFNESGTYKLRISSTLARWTVKIIQIEPEDVERYTPREVNPLQGGFNKK